MGNGPRYKVQTRYGWFSLDEGSYRDYLAGKLTWINWPPLRGPNTVEKRDPAPSNVSDEAIKLRDRADKLGLFELLQEYDAIPPAPCKERMYSLPIYELNLSVRASNGLMRAGIRTFEKLEQLIRSERGVSYVRNLGAKSTKEIHEAFLLECYFRLLPYEKAEFWQEVLELNMTDLSDSQRAII